jgi:predicted GNAT family acetyltransferase
MKLIVIFCIIEKKKMDIKQKDNAVNGMFYVEQAGDVVALMSYTWIAPDRLSINHTEVDDVLKGTGAGKKMVSSAVDFAREKGIKIIPMCSFAKSVFEKVDAFKDVL